MDPQVELNMGQGHRACHPPGHYAKLNKELEANFAAIESTKKWSLKAFVAQIGLDSHTGTQSLDIHFT